LGKRLVSGKKLSSSGVIRETVKRRRASTSRVGTKQKEMEKIAYLEVLGERKTNGFDDELTFDTEDLLNHGFTMDELEQYGTFVPGVGSDRVHANKAVFVIPKNEFKGVLAMMRTDKGIEYFKYLEVKKKMKKKIG